MKTLIQFINEASMKAWCKSPKANAELIKGLDTPDSWDVDDDPDYVDDQRAIGANFEKWYKPGDKITWYTDDSSFNSKCIEIEDLDSIYENMKTVYESDNYGDYCGIFTDKNVFFIKFFDNCVAAFRNGATPHDYGI